MPLTLVILALIFACPAPPAPDLSTPEKAAQAFAAMYLPRFYEDNAVATAIDENDYVGREHYSPAGWEQVQRVVADNKASRARSKTVRWSFRVGKVTRKGALAIAHVWVTQRRNRYDYATKKVKVIEQRIEHRFRLRRVDGRWLVAAASRTCLLCGATGKCGFCHGTGKVMQKRCAECQGSGVCSECQGKKLRPEELAASFKAGVLWDRAPGPYSPGDLSTPRAAAEGYLRLRARKQRVLGAIRRKHFATTLATWRPYFVPELVATFERNLAKSVADSEQRQAEWEAIAKVGALERRSDTKAYAMLLYTLPASRGRKGRVIKFRLDLRKVGARWLIEQLQTKCYSCKRTRICKFCSGSGKLPRSSATCVSCRGTGACNPCQGTGWIESTLLP